MKIVHVLPALTKGGGERVAAELANHAAQEGHEVTLVAAFPVDPVFLQNNLRADVTVVFISDKDHGHYRKTPGWVRKNRKWLLQQDVIHCHLTFGSFFGTLVYFLRKLTRQRKPVVVETYHAIGMAIPHLNRWIHSQLAKRRDTLVLMAEDEYWKNFVVNHPRLPVRIIPNGISIHPRQIGESEKQDYRREIGIPDSCRFVIGTVGRLHPDRQPARYVAIFSEVAKALPPDIHFVIGGDGPEMEKVRTAVHEAGLQNRIHLPGLIRNVSLPFSIFDLYVSLNVGAISGISTLEATLHGLPAVAFQMLDNYKASATDWVWSSTDNHEVAQKIITLIQQPSLLAQLAARQHAFAQEHYSLEAMAGSYEQLYAALLEQPVTLLAKREKPVVKKENNVS